MKAILIPSMHCSSCETYLTSLLSPLRLRNLFVDHKQKLLSFSGDTEDGDERTLLIQVERLLDKAGYDIEHSQSPAQSWFHAARSSIVGHERRKRKRHLQHCVSCQSDTHASTNGKDAASTLEAVEVHAPTPEKIVETRLSIEGMTCSSCTTAISSHMSTQSGVMSVTVNLVMNSAVVVHDSSIISPAKVAGEIEDIGYGASVLESRAIEKPMRKTVFGLQGMTCSSCSNTIEAEVRNLPGILGVSVSLMGNSMTVTFDPILTSTNAIIEKVGETGYEATQWESSDVEANDKAADNTRTVQIKVDGMFCGQCPITLNAALAALPLTSFTPLTISSPITTITYTPTPILTIRHIFQSLSPSPAFTPSLYTPPTPYALSRMLAARESAHLTRLFLISFAAAIPTFVFGVLGMTALPRSNSFREWCMVPIWGGAARAVIVLWILATIVQFGVGRVFYQRAFKGLGGGSNRKWKWSRLIHFGNMDLLVALSTSVAYFASIAMMILDIVRPSQTMGEGMKRKDPMTYFDSSVFLMFFILMGRLLEGKARVKTGDAISMLGSLRPEYALLITESEEQFTDAKRDYGKNKDEDEDSASRITSIPIDQIELHDLLLVQPGSVPPADGIVASDSSTFDESSLTGESLPVLKNPGDAVLSGTTNISSPIVMRVDHLDSETMLQKIVRAVAEGQARKAPIEKLADTITAIFVPVIVWLALGVLGIWLILALTGAISNADIDKGERVTMGDRVFFAFEFAISCLVIACPCGIGLAAPTAQAVGSGMAAQAGILAQGGGEAFQSASAVDTVVFDKTGTLTLGEVVVSDIEATGSDGVGHWLWHAVKEMEERSSHPLAVAVVKYCEALPNAADNASIRVLQSEEAPGKGLRAVISVSGVEMQVLVGNETFIVNDNNGVANTGLDSSKVQRWREKGHSVILVAVAPAIPSDSTPSSSSCPTPSSSSPPTCTIQAYLAISDKPRPEASATVAALHSSGKDVWMLSGDNEVTARAVAQSVGIEADHVVAGVLPHEKAEFIRTLQDRRRMARKGWWTWKMEERKTIVAFCGDGLNDTAALTAADVGIALAHGSQVTISAASFVLLAKSSVLTSLLTLLTLSRKVYRRQQLNFAWAMVYNIAMIPLAAGAFYGVHRTRLLPEWSALAMALSSVSVVTSSLALKWGL